MTVIHNPIVNNVGVHQYQHLYSEIIHSTSKHSANERPKSASVNEKSSINSDTNEKVLNYKDSLNTKYTNVSAVLGKTTNESSTKITVEKDTANKESVVKEASEFSNDVTIKSSLAKSKKSQKRKGKSLKRVRFTDDPESISFWRRFVRFFHFLSNYSRNTVKTLRTALSKYILLLYLSPRTPSLPIS